jgi:hypothetical protein
VSDSRAQEEDVAAVLGAQTARTMDQIELARVDRDVSVFGFVRDTLGPRFRKENLALAVFFLTRYTRINSRLRGEPKNTSKD